MAAPTDVYVDAALAANVGVGTQGNPYGDLQYALNSVTRDSTNGNRFLLKAGVDEVMTGGAIDLTTYGTPSASAPLVFEGYSTIAGDGNLSTGIVAGISGNGSNAVYANSGSKTFVHFKHLRMHNCGSADILTFGADCHVLGCQFDNTTGSGVVYSSANRSRVVGCYFTDIGTAGVNCPNNSCYVLDCFFMNGTKDFTVAISALSNGGDVLRNIIWVDGSSNGINVGGSGGAQIIANNSILCAGGTGSGIRITNGAQWAFILSNLVEGFSGSGGVGINFGSIIRQNLSTNNRAYNNATNFSSASGRLFVDNNEALTASPFAKSGAISYANRFEYFAPVNVGSVLGGSYIGG